MVNGFFGTLIAWVLVRYEFPGKQLIDGSIDLPFALPTAFACGYRSLAYLRDLKLDIWNGEERKDNW